MIIFGATNITEGATGLYNQYQGIGPVGYNPLKYGFNQLNPTWGNIAYNGVDFTLSILAMNVKVPLNVGLGDGMGRPTSMFGVTVSKIDNPILLPFTKMPLPTGTGAAVMAVGAGAKGVQFTNEIKQGVIKK